MVASRWLFALGIFLETFLQIPREHNEWMTWATLALLCLYNVGALILVHRTPSRRLPWRMMIALDLLLVGAAAYYTGVAQSPFLGQYYLVIFTGALLYGFRGGVLTGALCAFLVLVLVTFGGYSSLQAAADDIRDLVPYFLITGGFTGYLAERLRIEFRRAQRASEREQLRRAEETALHRELETARRMQLSALPSSPPDFPGLSFGVYWEFAREVGGDFFFYLTDRDRVGLVLGDVSGKGMPAALIATSISFLLPWLRPMYAPETALSELNRDLTARLPKAAFVTLALAEVSPREDSVRVWSAGHPPCLLWSERERTVRVAEKTAPLLGVLPEWSAEPEEMPMEPGDVLVLYSDGLIETRDRFGTFFDTDGAVEVLRRHAHCTPDEIAAALAEAARAWGPQTDDLSVLVCKRDYSEPAVAAVCDTLAGKA